VAVADFNKSRLFMLPPKFLVSVACIKVEHSFRIQAPRRRIVAANAESLQNLASQIAVLTVGLSNSAPLGSGVVNFVIAKRLYTSIREGETTTILGMSSCDISRKLQNAT
jgi:hypothetical protein